MEKLIQITILVICCQFTFAQSNLCVFSSSGTNYIEVSGKKKIAAKGSVIGKKDKVIIGADANIIAIDDQGNSYRVAKSGKFTFSKLLGFKQKSAATGITGKYFKLVWDELTGKSTNERVIGGVFRGEVLMVLPKDSSKVLETKVTLRWKSDEGKTVFIFVRNKTTDEILKFESDGSQLTLFADNPIFDEGKEFEWTVSEREFVNLKNAVFYGFTLIDKSTYREMVTQFTELQSEMTALKMSDSEIKNALCILYRICN